jgi:hypothetical protein
MFFRRLRTHFFADRECVFFASAQSAFGMLRNRTNISNTPLFRASYSTAIVCLGVKHFVSLCLSALVALEPREPRHTKIIIRLHVNC